MDEILEQLSILLSDSSLDEDLYIIYINFAVTAIKKYLGNDTFTKDYILKNFQDAVLLLVWNSVESRKNNNIKSKTEGNRSVTYTDSTRAFTITEDVAELLPAPYIRMFY